MERKDYPDRTNSLLNAVQTLLDAKTPLESLPASPLWLTFIETCKLQKKAALDFFNGFFKMVTEGRCDYELIAQEALG